MIRKYCLLITVMLLGNTLISQVNSSDSIKSNAHFKESERLYSEGRYELALDELKLALKYDPESTSNLYSMSLILNRMGRHSEALNYARDAYEIEITKSPIDSNALFRIYVEKGEIFYSLNRNKDAIEVLSKALELDDSHFFPYYLRGIVHMELSEFDKASDDLNIAYEKNNSVIIQFAYRKLLSKKGEYKEAIRNLDLGKRNNNLDPETYYFLGLSYYKIGDLFSAIEYLEEYLSFRDGESSLLNIEEALIFIGLSYYKSSNFKQAIASFQDYLEIVPDNYVSLFFIADSYIELKEYDKAKKTMNLSRKLFPNKLVLNLNAISLHGELGNKDSVSYYLKKAENAEFDPLLLDTAGYYELLLSGYLFVEDTAKILEVCNKAIKLSIKDEPFLIRKVEYEKVSDKSFPELLAILDYLIESSNNNKKKAYYLARKGVLMCKIKKCKESIQIFDDAIKYSQDAEYYLARADARLQVQRALGNKEITSIRSDIESAKKLEPGNSMVYMFGAELFLFLNEPQKACEQLQTATKHGGWFSENLLSDICNPPTADSVPKSFGYETRLTPYSVKFEAE